MTEQWLRGQRQEGHAAFLTEWAWTSAPTNMSWSTPARSDGVGRGRG